MHSMDTLVRLNNSIDSSETLLQCWIQKVFGDLSLSIFLCLLPSLPCHEVPLLDPDRLFWGSTLSSPAGLGQSPVAKHFLFILNKSHLWL